MAVPSYKLGCVSFLNAKPLIQGLEALHAEIALQLNIPSLLLADLLSDHVDAALCPVIDYFTSAVPLKLLQSGCIGCLGSTLTVVLCSQVPIGQITSVHADTDSHTSVVLLQVLLAKKLGLKPKIIDYHRASSDTDLPQSVLLIGDKVVTHPPSKSAYPYQMDLGEAWHDLTGLPFVFAIWMAKQTMLLGDLPQQLADCLEQNKKQIQKLVDTHADGHGWPRPLAYDYLTKHMRYEVGPSQCQAIQHFAKLAFELGLIEHTKPLTFDSLAVYG